MSNDPKMVEKGLVDMRHPSLVDAVKNMTKQNQQLEQISRVTGLPIEAVKQIQSENK
jgi:predicted transposase YdaD